VYPGLPESSSQKCRKISRKIRGIKFDRRSNQVPVLPFEARALRKKLIWPIARDPGVGIVDAARPAPKRFSWNRPVGFDEKFAGHDFIP
jgi:hypothetical protein